MTATEAAPGLFVDVCATGCRGLWFDHFELQRLDERHEHPDSPVLKLSSEEAKAGTAASGARRVCPRCDEVALFSHFFSVKRKIQIESCPQCGGHWLDPGELQLIREEFQSTEAREEAALAEIEASLGPHRQAQEARQAGLPKRRPLLLGLVSWIVAQGG